MSTRITHQADGTARGQTQQNTANSIIDLRKQPARTPKQAKPAKPDCCGQPPAAPWRAGWRMTKRCTAWHIGGRKRFIECRVCGKFYYRATPHNSRLTA